jgi:hypothetical protein
MSSMSQTGNRSASTLRCQIAAKTDTPRNPQQQ